MRRRRAPVRPTPPDEQYGSTVVTKFINALMKAGKKGIARRNFYGALQIVEESTGESGFEAFSRAIEAIKPPVEVRPRRVGGSTYQIPVEVRPKRQQFLAIKWMLKSVTSRGERSLKKRIANEILDILKGQGNSMKTRENTIRMAEANKVFAHFRW